MTWNIRKILLGTTLSLIVLLVCIGLGLLPLNLFFLKSTITEAVQERTGAELVIEGPLRLQLGMQPKLTAREVLVHWPDETRPLSASIRDMAIQTRLSSIWRGDIDLQDLTARGIQIDAGSGEFDQWLPDQLHLEVTAPVNKAISLVLEGQVRNEDWTVSLNGASLETLLAATREYPLGIDLILPGSGLQFNGSILLPWDTPGVAGQLAVQSKDLSSLLLHLGQEMPGLGQLSLRSGLELNASRIELDGLEGTLDDFSFTLSALARDWSTRPWIDITAAVPLVDPATLPGITKDGADSEPDAPMDLQPLFDQLAGFDGQVKMTVGQVDHSDFPIRDLAVSASLDNGLLTITDATASTLGIEISAGASLETRAACARLETSVWIPAIDLSTLSVLLESDNALEGSLENSRINTESCGAFLRDHLQSLETAFEVDALVLSGADDQAPLEIRNIDATVNWQKAGRFSFESELMGEPLVLSAGFGSVEQMAADELWPVSLKAKTNTVDLAFSGQTAVHETGLILDLTLAARVGKSDVSGELAWSALDSGLPLKADLRSKFLSLEDLELLLPDDKQDESGSVQDWSEFLDDTELLEQWDTVPSINVKLAVDQLGGTSYEIGRIGLDAQLKDFQLKDGRMQLDFEGVEMEGLINVDAHDPVALFDYHVSLKNLDIGRLMKSMALSDTVDAHVEQADVHFGSRGATLRELGRNMKIDSNVKSLRWAFLAGPENRTFNVNLSDITVQASPGANVTWETQGSLNGYPLNAWLQTPNLRAVFDGKTALPVRFIVATRNDITMLDLVVHPETEKGVRSRFQVSGRYSNTEDVDFSALPSPLEDYSFSTDLTFSKNEYLASNIEARVGSSNANGRLSIRPSGEGFDFDLDAGSTFLETDDLVLWMREFREAREIISAPETADPEEAQIPAGLLTMIDQYAEDFIGDNTWDVDVKVSELRSGGRLLGDTAFNLHMVGREVVLDPATIRLPGGNVSVRYSGVEASAGWDYKLDIYLERLEYGGLLRLYDPDSTAEGVLHVDTSLHSSAARPEDVANHLEGTVDLAVFPEDVEAGFLDLWTSNLVLALLPLGENKQKKLNCMVARFELEEGVMKSRETFLDSTETIVRVRGDIDLANRQLDLLAVPQAKTENFLSVSTPIQVSGPFDDFSVGVTSGGFVMTMIRWYYGLIYVPWKWLTGERFPADGTATCFHAMDWELPTGAK